MKIFEIIKKNISLLEKNATKIYLILANIILAVFAVWFSNAGLLPFNDMGNFAFFAALALILGIYRPSWTFAFFIGTLALENINLAPKGLGVSIRPYQLFGAITIIALLVQLACRRLVFPLPKWRWFDGLPILFALAGFLSSFGAQNRGSSLKQSIVAVSFVALYYLARVYVQSLEDLKRVAPFFLSSSLVVLVYSVWQNLRFLAGGNSFEVMPGRPNATFTEPDWYGIFLVFLIAVVYTILYKFSVRITKKQETITKQITNLNVQNYKRFDCLKFGDWILFVSCILCLVISYIALILTVSRSAWVGAVIVTIGFLKIVLTQGSFKIQQWQWKKFSLGSAFVILALMLSVILIQIIPLSNFQIFNRAASTSGLQKITISCQPGHLQIPESIGNISELSAYGCKFINLEDIASEKAAGNAVSEIFRTDPTVNIRAQIYQKSIDQIKAHPIFGIGWGTISAILGTDERGAGLNASNIFLEIWLGGGLLGILSFVALLCYIIIIGAVQYLNPKVKNKTVAAFVLLGWVAVTIPNLFNSGIFLGFVWVYLAVAVSLLNEKNN